MLNEEKPWWFIDYNDKKRWTEEESRIAAESYREPYIVTFFVKFIVVPTYWSLLVICVILWVIFHIPPWVANAAAEHYRYWHRHPEGLVLGNYWLMVGVTLLAILLIPLCFIVLGIMTLTIPDPKTDSRTEVGE